MKVGQPEQLRRWKSAVLQELQVGRKGDGKVIFAVPGQMPFYVLGASALGYLISAPPFQGQLLPRPAVGGEVFKGEENAARLQGLIRVGNCFSSFFGRKIMVYLNGSDDIKFFPAV